jgi:hypothetical protein
MAKSLTVLRLQSRRDGLQEVNEKGMREKDFKGGRRNGEKWGG